MKIEDIKIDEEFKNLLPGLSNDELKQLRDNIVSDGEFRDAIVVWDKTLVDGHNRLDVWGNLTKEERKNVQKPHIQLKSFDSREAAMEWMVMKQLGQRNLTSKQRSYLIGLKYESTKRNRNDNLNNVSEDQTESSIVQNGQSTNTANEVAEETGVSSTQVRRNEKFKKAIDAIEKHLGSDAKKELMDKKNKVAKSKIIEIGKLPPEKMQAAFDRAMGRGTPSGGDSFEPSEWENAEEEVLDGLKKPVPDELKTIFSDVHFFDEKVRELQKINREVKEQAKAVSGGFIRVQDIEADLKNAINAIKFAKPYTVCPTCKFKIKKTCKNCKGSGYITKRHYGESSGSGTLTKAEREWLANR